MSADKCRSQLPVFEGHTLYSQSVMLIFLHYHTCDIRRWKRILSDYNASNRLNMQMCRDRNLCENLHTLSVWSTQKSPDKHHYNELCHVLAGLEEYCTSIHMFSVCFCHCPGTGFSREDSIIAVSLEFGEEEVMELIRLYFLKWHHLINSKKHFMFWSY